MKLEWSAAIRQAIVLDPLNTEILTRLGEAQWATRQYEQALATFNAVIALDPVWARRAWRGFVCYGLGDCERARSSCEEGQGRDVGNGWSRLCLAWVYHKLGRHADAEALLAKQRAALGDLSAYQFAWICARGGEMPPNRVSGWRRRYACVTRA